MCVWQFLRSLSVWSRWVSQKFCFRYPKLINISQLNSFSLWRKTSTISRVLWKLCIHVCYRLMFSTLIDYSSQPEKSTISLSKHVSNKLSLQWCRNCLWSEKTILQSVTQVVHLRGRHVMGDIIVTCTWVLELFVAEQLSAVQTSVAAEELAVLPAPANQTKHTCI